MRRPNSQKVSRESDTKRQHERFVTRAKAVFYTRIFVAGLCVVCIIVPKWHAEIIEVFGDRLVPWLGIFIAYSLLARLLAPSEEYGRWAYFLSLCCDLGCFFCLLPITGGLMSPLMNLSPIFTIFFTLTFHNPILIAFPAMAIPIAAIGTAFLGASMPLHYQLLLILFYASLNAVASSLTAYSLSREENQTRKIIALEKKLSQLAVVEERSRFSQDIHDGLGGTLTALLLQIESLLILPNNSFEMQTALKNIYETVQEAIIEARQAITILKQEFDLKGQVRQKCEDIQKRHHITTVFQCSGTVPHFDPKTEIGIYRIVQESLNNIVKHSKCARAKVEIVGSNDLFKELKITIQDDGVGFDPDQTPAFHYGIKNMRSRASAMGAHLTLSTHANRGTKIELTVDELA